MPYTWKHNQTQDPPTHDNHLGYTLVGRDGAKRKEKGPIHTGSPGDHPEKASPLFNHSRPGLPVTTSTEDKNDRVPRSHSPRDPTTGGPHGTGCSGHRLPGGLNGAGKAFWAPAPAVKPHAFAQLTLLNSCSLARSLSCKACDSNTPFQVFHKHEQNQSPGTTKQQKPPQHQHHPTNSHNSHSPTYRRARERERDREREGEGGGERTVTQTDRQNRQAGGWVQVTLRESRGEEE